MGHLHCCFGTFLIVSIQRNRELYKRLRAAVAIAVPCGGARGTCLCYKGGPGQRAFSVPECPVSIVRTPVCACIFIRTRRKHSTPQHADRFGHLLFAICSNSWSRSRYVNIFFRTIKRFR